MGAPYIFSKNALLITFGFFLFGFVSAQTTICKGKVTDAKTGEPLPYVAIGFVDSKIGAVSDIDGNYVIESYYATQELQASFVGYNTLIKLIKKDREQIIDFQLEVEQQILNEVVIRPDKDYENPAHVIFRRIIANKNANNREKLNAYDYEIYNKVEIDIDNPRKKLINFFLFRPIDFVFDNIDSTSEETPFLPVFLSESVSEYYYKKNPKKEREYIKASEISGLQNESVSQLLGDMYQNVNIYHNHVTIFDRSFISPLADNGLVHYRYYLVDSAMIGNKWCYNIQFQPRRKQELTFKGNFWVNDTTYAIKKIEATMARDANINFITNFYVEQEYSEVEDEVWMLTKDKLKINARFLMPHNARYEKFIGRKTTSYKDFTINQLAHDSIYGIDATVTLLKDAENYPVEIWDTTRHYDLTQSEASVYQMIDSVMNSTYYKVWNNILRGYYRIKYIEIGPYFGMYSFNSIEGDRLKLAARTSRLVHPDLRINAYGAYGLLDQEWKYGGSFRFYPSRYPRQYLKFSFKKDLEQLGSGGAKFGNDNLITSLSRISAGNLQNGVREFYGLYERNWNNSIATQFRFDNRQIWALGDLNFQKLSIDGDSTSISNITTSELTLGVHYSFLERFLETSFNRTSLGSDYPMFDIQYTYGIPNVLGSTYNYHKTKISISQKVRLGIYGTSKYKIEAGKIWGGTPLHFS
ncbi:MAG: carboxypeptidase-like regulatory domain-containing protein [Flavobacteriales bacterium]|nr:carboxypeptidase-like regulatory domain-containing protein [Flavobacteriales bacterium]